MNIKASVALILCIFTHSLISTSHAAQSSSSIKDQQQAKLESTVMNQNLTLEKRVKALKSLLKDEIIDGSIQRTFCVWDPLGKAGPVTAAADDQVLRSLHYGMALTIETFQNENEHIERFLDENIKFSKNYFPFGAGPRMCIGNNFAMYEMILAIIALVAEFEIIEKESPIQIKPLITLKPHNAILEFKNRI